MAKKITLVLLSLVFVLAFAVRFWKLSEVPASLSMDEIAIGYNAYSILKTGRDEYGVKFPLAFKSVGDYKTPVGIYFVVPSISIFNLNEFAVRFPEALFGAATSVCVFFLLVELGIGLPGAFFGSVFIALNPWHVYHSRVSFEGVAALLFVLLGTLFFLKFIKKKSIPMLSLSTFFLALSFWSYHAERVFVPILFIFLIVYFRREVVSIIKRNGKVFLPLAIALLMALPFLYSLINGSGVILRASDLWIGRDPNTNWLQQYLKYFDLYVWFFKGLNFTLPGYPGVGFLYLVDLPFFAAGLFALFRTKNRVLKAITIFWFLVGPFPGSLTRGGINPGRTLVWLPFFVFVTSLGFEFIYNKTKNKLTYMVYGILLIWNVFFFWDMFSNNFPKFWAGLWHYGYKDAAIFVCQNHQKYKKVVVTDKYGIDLPDTKTIPYLYFLFYCNVDPSQYQQDGQIYNIEFRQPQWRIDSKEKDYLLIGSKWDFPEDFDKSKIMKTIYFPKSAYEPKQALYFVETNDYFVNEVNR